MLSCALVLGAALLSVPARAQQGGVFGDVPAGGGLALVTWSGGPVEALDSALRTGGCDTVSVWISHDGGFVGYTVGALAFVNAAFVEAVGPEVPASAPLLVRCSTRAHADESAEFASVVPDWIEGLTAGSETRLQAPYDSYVTWPVIEGYPLLGDTVKAEIDARREAFEQRVGPPVPGSPIVPEFNVGFDFIVASGTVVGVRLEQFEFLGAGGANLATTLWFDTAAGRRVPATALLDGDPALQRVAEIVREALRRDRPDLGLPDLLEAGSAPTEENYDSIGFTPAGDLLVEFDEYQVGPGASGSPRVVIPIAIAEPLLSDFGRQARQEVLDSSGQLELPEPSPPPTPTPEPEAAVPPAASVDCDQVACVALTFDDGPAQATARLLDILKRRGSHATFFMVGSNVPYHPDLVARMVAEGHEVGNHTLDHRDLTKLGPEEVLAQIVEAGDAIEAAGGRRPRLLRPPYGAVDETVSTLAGMPLVLWSVDPRDWADHDPSAIAQRVAAEAHRGSIVLMHDLHETTVDAVPAILDDFDRRGLTAVTVSELLGDDLVAGRVYRGE